MNPFAITLPKPPGVPAPVTNTASRIVNGALGLTRLQRLYEARRSADLFTEALRLMNISVRTPDTELASIPRRGPLVVLANHPTGALDGITLMWLLRQRRTDAKLLANHLTLRVPELRDHVIAVDAFGRDHRLSRTGLREARDWLTSGGALIVFPAGEVSSIVDADQFVVDPPWRRGVLTLIDWTSAAVVPAYIDAQNRRLFRWAGLVHPLLRTAMLPREFLARQNSTLHISFDTPVSAERLQEFPDSDARLAYLRARTYALRTRSARLAIGTNAVADGQQPIADMEPSESIAADVEMLPSHMRLLTSGDYAVYCAPAEHIPAVLREIGRLREVSFRAVGEGTGAARDLDRFDQSYLHLFVWDRTRRELVGAYRLGPTDRLGATRDTHALYSRTLFEYGPRLVRELSPALELGRSFVRPEYQRESNALFLLWRGIGAFVAREPRYRYLFGAVSVSANYGSVTRQLVARYLSREPFLSHLSHMVRPTRPPGIGTAAADLLQSRVVSTLDDIESLVKDLEGGRGLPVLLRQYLKLNARLLGFSVDPQFGNVLDGLIVVDVLEAKPASLQRYFGKDAASAILSHHRPPAAAASGGSLQTLPQSL